MYRNSNTFKTLNMQRSVYILMLPFTSTKGAKGGSPLSVKPFLHNVRIYYI